MFSKERQGVVLDGRGGGEELGKVEGGDRLCEGKSIFEEKQTTSRCRRPHAHTHTKCPEDETLASQKVLRREAKDWKSEREQTEETLF